MKRLTTTIHSGPLECTSWRCDTGALCNLRLRSSRSSLSATNLEVVVSWKQKKNGKWPYTRIIFQSVIETGCRNFAQAIVDSKRINHSFQRIFSFFWVFFTPTAKLESVANKHLKIRSLISVPLKINIHFLARLLHLPNKIVILFEPFWIFAP